LSVGGQGLAQSGGQGLCPVGFSFPGGDEVLEHRREVGSLQLGRSCFLRDGERVFHTYSHYARGTEGTQTPYTLLDLTAMGRQEDWEKPEGRADDPRPPQPAFER